MDSNWCGIDISTFFVTWIFIHKVLLIVVYIFKSIIPFSQDITLFDVSIINEFGHNALCTYGFFFR